LPSGASRLQNQDRNFEMRENAQHCLAGSADLIFKNFLG
jgi:hypothetical protein